MDEPGGRDLDSFELDAIESAIEDVAAGKIIIVVDDACRENEGDMFVAAELCTQESMNFFVRHARGLVCVPLAREIAERLDLGLMVERNSDPHGTAFTVS
ncbi:MAG: 3,4-dihydroxy-2-butanone-4-phosphate synthase, partial [Synergistaceae bacterium]|nr:3,4-dihydroxy-2-butanone-4-phosphate synthase [Synergistaceae bacterium]